MIRGKELGPKPMTAPAAATRTWKELRTSPAAWTPHCQTHVKVQSNLHDNGPYDHVTFLTSVSRPTSDMSPLINSQTSLPDRLKTFQGKHHLTLTSIQ